MAEAAVATDCVCGHVTAEVIQCPQHFHLFKAGRRLVSIGSIVRSSFPLPTGIPEDVLANAMDRGKVVDGLFSDYVRGTLAKIHAGTRRDSVDLFLKLVKWYDRQNFKTVEAQVLLGCEDHGGVLDLRLDGIPFELKATYDVGHEHRMQAAGYANLAASHGNIIHVTERYAEPRIVPLQQADYGDWEILLTHWRMLQRRSPAKT